MLPISPTEPPIFILGDAVAGSDSDANQVTWSPQPGSSRIVLDDSAGDALPLAQELLRVAAAARIPTLAIGPYPERYRAAHARAVVFGAGSEVIGYAEVPEAVAELAEFVDARSDWRLLLVHLERPALDADGRLAWEPAFGKVAQLDDPEIQALVRLEAMLRRLATTDPPRLMVISVFTDNDPELAELLPAEMYRTTISAGLHLEYQAGPYFDSELPSVDQYLPELEAQVDRLHKLRLGGAFWSGMNPKRGRIVLASLHGSATQAVLILDPPAPEPWWAPTREAILAAARRQATDRRSQRHPRGRGGEHDETSG
ncbi:hypothetical protein GA707_18645 [Nostocoides sp. F2B08]|uniref:hypothetical protein n=1 Tax=Nostocoides sp. F2B08 TaxID=2653936 RepID=UPI0012637A23|nr:hypothetical protein [Tetrasphaera sp. F2B08]KAB7740917.1 hypothetical protein GA707_18645 [Tetrasphaera sp. F2B08]